MRVSEKNLNENRLSEVFDIFIELEWKYLRNDNLNILIAVNDVLISCKVNSFYGSSHIIIYVLFRIH